SYTKDRKRQVTIAAKQDVIAILDQVGSVTRNGGVIMILRRAANNPTNVCPPATVTWGMRITNAVSVRMMHSMRRNPLKWSTLYRQRGARNKKILNEFRHFVTAVSEQAMKTHANTEAAGNPIKNNSANHSGPAPKE